MALERVLRVRAVAATVARSRDRRRLAGVLLVAALAPVACRTGQDGAPAHPVKLELAPIEAADLLVRESFPPSYAVTVTSGLPSGCAAFERIDVERSASRVALTVWNRVPADSEAACTAIYGTTAHTAELGSDFTAGRGYDVVINSELRLSFEAQ